MVLTSSGSLVSFDNTSSSFHDLYWLWGDCRFSLAARLLAHWCVRGEQTNTNTGACGDSLLQLHHTQFIPPPQLSQRSPSTNNPDAALRQLKMEPSTTAECHRSAVPSPPYILHTRAGRLHLPIYLLDHTAETAVNVHVDIDEQL